MTSRTKLFLAVLLSLALLASACGSGSSGDAATSTDSDSVSTSDADSEGSEGSDGSDSDDSSDADDETASISPISDFLGVPSFDPSNPEESQAIFEQQEREREEAIALCMRAEGFEYTPRDPSEYNFFEDDGGLEWGSDEWVQTYGFGVTTQSFSQSEVGDGLIGYDDSRFEDFEEEAEEDPNWEYQESLPEAERIAYEETLWGEEPDLDFEAMTEEEINEFYETFEWTGCANVANEDDIQQQFYTEFGDAMGEMYEAMEADPRIVEAQAKIEECVVGKGVEFVSEQDAWEHWEDQLSPMRDRLYGAFDEPNFGGQEDVDFEAMTDEEINDFYESLPQPELTAEDKVLLAELQQEEIAIAVANAECGGGYANQEELYSELLVEYEQRFLEDNAAALEAFQAAE